MCGIIGGFWRRPSSELQSKITTALAHLRHRGPDDNGIMVAPLANGTVALGQTRLSIIDLSSGGHQPMSNFKKTLTIVYNGELYNYRELREELQRRGRVFKTESDTEVLLESWSEWGKAALTKFEGMFAFAIYDSESKKIFCARDGFGIKPFFYLRDENEFIFASEQRAISDLASKTIKPDLQSSYDYLVHGVYDSSERTFIDGVRHLLPGTLLEVNLAAGGALSIETWWRAPTEQSTALTYSQAVDAVREEFLRSVRLHLRSDVPLGAALSGGIDSSAVVCAMRYLDPSAEIHTFSYIADNQLLSEEKWVDLINDTVRAKSHKVNTSGNDLIRDLDDVVRVQGEPFGSTSIYAQYRVFQIAREHGITVTLDGQGADELFAGYDGYPGQRMLSLWESSGFSSMNEFARLSGRWPGRSYQRNWMEFGRIALPNPLYSGVRSILGREFKPRWMNLDMLADEGVIFTETRAPRKPESKGRRVIEKLAHSLQVHGLPHLLRHGDRNAMAFSIESRVPFLTLPIAQLCLSMPEHYLVSNDGEPKSIFRAAMRGIVPDPILDRRDKVGFATPELDWFHTIEPVVRNWLQDAQGIPFLNSDILIAHFNDVMSGRRRFSWQIWRWINYIRWYKNQEF